jgi:hypothetical protein
LTDHGICGLFRGVEQVLPSRATSREFCIS